MAKYDHAPLASINGKAYRDYLIKHPKAEKITLTRGQMEAIIRDLCDYTERDADARGWAEQATMNAAEIARLRADNAAILHAIDAVDAHANRRGETTRADAPSRAHSFTRGMKVAISMIRNFEEPRIDFPERDFDAVAAEAKNHPELFQV